MTQRRMILTHFETFDTLTPRRALAYYGIMRLGARIWELRQDGWAISMRMKAAYNRFGTPTHYAEYRMGVKDED